MRLAGAGLLACTVPLAYAGADFKIDDDVSLSAGIGLRASFTSLEKGAPNGNSHSDKFALENLQIYTGIQYGKYLKATFNTERPPGPATTGAAGIRVMDAIAQLEPYEAFNVWVGRMLPPSDRANLAGSFYTVPWSFPLIVSNYPMIVFGRDDGATFWGKPMGGKVVYAAGAYSGHNRAAGLSNTGNSLLYAGRIAVNFLDSEPPPAYYTASSYGGSKDIFTVALAGQFQSNGVGTAADPANLKIWNADVLFEKKLAGGYVPALEGAYYHYDTGGKADCGTGEPGAGVCPVADNVGGQVQGKAYLAGAALLFPTVVGWGQFQPFIRYQKYNRDLSQTTNKGADFGVNYLIKGLNARISAVYSKFDDSQRPPGATSMNQFVVGVQFKY